MTLQMQSYIHKLAYAHVYIRFDCLFFFPVGGEYPIMVVQSARIAGFRGNSIPFPS